MCQIRESRETRRNWFDTWRWPCASLAKVEKEEEAVHRRSVQLAPVCAQAQPSMIFFLLLPVRIFLAIKRKEKKKKEIIFIFQRCCLSLIYNIITFHSIKGFTNVRQWSGRPGFNPRSSHTKDSKMVLDATLLNTQHYKVWIKCKVEQYRERSSVLLYTSV